EVSCDLGHHRRIAECRIVDGVVATALTVFDVVFVHAPALVADGRRAAVVLVLLWGVLGILVDKVHQRVARGDRHATVDDHLVGDQTGTGRVEVVLVGPLHDQVAGIHLPLDVGTGGGAWEVVIPEHGQELIGAVAVALVASVGGRHDRKPGRRGRV